MKLSKEECEQFKKCESDKTVSKKNFCGARVVTLSTETMTEARKKGYVEFFEAISRSDLAYKEYEYLDIDKLKEHLEKYPEKTREIFKLYYGLDDGNRLSGTKIAEMYGMSRNNTFIRMNTAIRKIKGARTNRVDVKSKLQNMAEDTLEFKEIQANIEAIKTIKKYISEHLSEGAVDLYTISADKLALESETFNRVAAKILGVDELVENMGYSSKLSKILRIHGIKTIFDLMHYSKKDVLRFRNLGEAALDELEAGLAERGIKLRDNDEANLDTEEQDKKPKTLQIGDITIEDMNLSVRAFNVLNRNNAQSISEITNYSTAQLFRFHNMGKKTLEEIIGKLAEYGVKTDDEGNFVYPENTEIVIAPEETKAPEDLEAIKVKREAGIPVNNELLKRCDLVLGEYQDRIKLLNLDRKEELYELCRELLRYHLARTNYLEKEDIFDPNAIVEGIPISSEPLTLEELRTVKQEIDKMVEEARATLLGEHSPKAVVDLEDAIKRLAELDEQRGEERNYVCTRDGAYTKEYDRQIKEVKKEIEKIMQMKGRFNADVQSGISMVELYYKRMNALKRPDNLDDFFVRVPYIRSTEWHIEQMIDFAQKTLDCERENAKPPEEELQSLEIVQALVSDIIQEREDKQNAKEDEISEEDKRKRLIAHILEQQKELSGLKATLRGLEENSDYLYDE